MIKKAVNETWYDEKKFALLDKTRFQIQKFIAYLAEDGVPADLILDASICCIQEVSAKACGDALKGLDNLDKRFQMLQKHQREQFALKEKGLN